MRATPATGHAALAAQPGPVSGPPDPSAKMAALPMTSLIPPVAPDDAAPRTAEAAERLLRTALTGAAFDVEREFAELGAAPDALGRPAVRLGALPPATAARLARMLHAPDPARPLLLTEPARPDSVGRMRHRISRALTENGNGHLAERVVLVASELLTNALLHGALGHDPLTATLTNSGGTLVLAVPDNNPAPPMLRDPGTAAVDGRGVLLVELLADAWGFRCERGGKTVTAEFDAASTPHDRV